MKYFLKKFVTMIITLIIVTFFVFFAFNFISGDAAVSILGTNASPERLAELRTELGLDRSLPVRYLSWLLGFFRGDLGISYSYRIPVAGMIRDKVPVSLSMALYAFVLMIIMTIPLGIFMAKHEGTVIDRSLYVTDQVIMAIPPFFSGILITFLFGRVFRLFTPGGYVSYKTSIPGFLGYMFFPALAIALPKAAMAVKLLRSSLLKEYSLDYVRTAFSRGNSTNDVLYNHMLKNAILPTLTFFGMALADMIAGSIIVEQVFSIPGLGRILLTSISNRDHPVVMAVIVIIALLVLISNMLVDVLYSIIDPRISLED